MILQPEFVTRAFFEEAYGQVQKKKPLPALSLVRFEPFCEGKAAQNLHIGPYADESPVIARLHRYIEDQRHKRCGRHHEIYLNDPNRTAPARLKTVIRQPFQ